VGEEATPRETPMPTGYALGEKICQVRKNTKLGYQVVGGQFFLFCQKYVDTKLIWQTVEDALTV
jgi:hypothetical protein